ncbi:Kunitz trypsin inhibitor 2 [Vitis vinifera]|uniref:Kunitz trypsin inhibitor 2 n=1 Tax=Vitis vinifera TaxID=29760 RepID=A0A438GQS6_VITVI|nr:Kunitz trypsin inhibitor 2 [Vitis vinifera]
MAPSSQLIAHSCLSCDYDCHQSKLIISLNKTIKAFILAWIGQSYQARVADCPNRLGPSTPFGIEEEGNLSLLRQMKLILVQMDYPFTLMTKVSLATQVAPDPLLDIDGKKLRSGPAQGIKWSPVDIHADEPKKGVIRTLTDHNIKFSTATTCVQSTVWKLNEIEKYEDDYKLVFYPTTCDFCRPICGDIDIYIQDGYRCLALSDVPLKVMFKRA